MQRRMREKRKQESGFITRRGSNGVDGKEKRRKHVLTVVRDVLR